MKQLLNLIADNLYEESLAHRMRLKRHQLFLNVFKNILDKKIVILDIGGTEKYWKMMNFEKDVSIVLLNRNYKKVNGDIFKAQIGDARNLELNHLILYFRILLLNIYQILMIKLKWQTKLEELEKNILFNHRIISL